MYLVLMLRGQHVLFFLDLGIFPRSRKKIYYISEKYFLDLGK